MNDYKMTVREVYDRQPESHARVSVCITNHIIEFVIAEKRSKYLNNYQRVNGNMYIDKRTGEVREYSNNSTINRNRSFTRLRRYVNANFTNQNNEIFLTLTYSNPQFNRSQVSIDMKNFWKRFKYRHKTCEYISIFEPHESGAWHIHMLIKDLKKTYFRINIKECSKLWKHGGIKILKLKGNDNIGAYFTALYKFDCLDSETVTQNKSDRIKFYPRHSKCFSHSENIRKPIYKTMSYENAIKLVENSNECFSKTIGIFDDEDTEVNTIYYKQFNSKRENKGDKQ